MVGHRDRAQALLARGREQHLDRRRAVVRVVGVHVQVDVDQRPRRRARRAAPGRRAASWRRAASSRVDRLELVGRAVVVGRRAGSRRGSGAPSARPSPAGSRCARPGGRRSSPRSAARRSVESSRSVEEWKEPTFSAREWRSAALDVLGANGSCTCTKSSSTVLSSSSIVRATSIGSAGGAPAARRRGDVEHLADGDHARRRRRRCPRAALCGSPARGAQRPARVAHPLLRARRREISTRCPRRESSRGDARDVRVDLVVLAPPTDRA